MITSIIFDFGDIFINLDKQAPANALKSLGLSTWNTELDHLNFSFEKGQITKTDFLSGIQKYVPQGSIEEITSAWNSVLLDFPKRRLDFLKKISSSYRLFLLSNTDSIHIANFESKHGETFCSEFYHCFEKVHFSFEMGMRKPDADIYQYVLDCHNLEAATTLFVDDKKENTDAALALGIQVWNLQVGQEDVVDMLSICKSIL
jgi:FMN phosphatase YigB (HAD superfamily)